MFPVIEVKTKKQAAELVGALSNPSKLKKILSDIEDDSLAVVGSGHFDAEVKE